MFKNKLIPAAAGRQARSNLPKLAERRLSSESPLPPACICLQDFQKVVLGLALLSWPVIGYSLRMSNADWVDPIFKPTRIAADVNNVHFIFVDTI